MKRSYEAEMMDLPDPPEALLVEDLRNLRIINVWLGNHRNVLGAAQGPERAPERP